MIQIIDKDWRRRAAAERLLRQAGFMTQSFRSPEEFLKAVLPVPTSVAKPQQLKARLDRLTRRETQVFERIVLGWPNKKVAQALGTGVQTIKFHRAHLMAKMRATCFADLVRMADQLGMYGRGSLTNVKKIV